MTAITRLTRVNSRLGTRAAAGPPGRGPDNGAMTHSPPASRPLQLWLAVFLPFACGYFLSYLYRVVNAVIAPSNAVKV